MYYLLITYCVVKILLKTNFDGRKNFLEFFVDIKLSWMAI